MTQTPFLYKHPLLLLHLACWTIYLLADCASHVTSGYFDLFPSVIGGLAGCLLSGFTGLIHKSLNHWSMKLRGAVVGATLYGTAIVWDKILIIFHTEGQMTYSQSFNKVLNHSLSDWLRPNYTPLLIFIAWALFLAASTYFMAYREQQIQLSEAQLQTRQAQLQTLRYQLNPHFLFNVLNSIDVSVLSDDKETAHKMLQHLSRFLRSSLQQGEQDKIRLDREFEILRNFISIEQLRFGDALKLELELDPQCQDAMLPPMLLQPLVENAIKFAWSQTEQGHVQLIAGKEGRELVIQIINSKAEGDLDKSGTGTGLRNTAERLHLVYGDDARLETQDQPQQFRIELRMPLEQAVSSHSHPIKGMEEA